MDALVYANVANTRYTRPTDTSPYAQHGLGDTAAAQAGNNFIHNEERRMYDLDNNVDATLKQEIIASVEEKKIYTKKQRYMGFHGVSAKILVDHFMERYGKICVSDLEAYRQALAEPIELDRLINLYFQRLEDGIQFSQDGNTPLTPAHIVHKANHSVKNTGIYFQALKEWRKKSPAYQN